MRNKNLAFSKDNGIIKEVCENIVNVKSIMRELTAVGKFLDVADLGSDSLECNIQVKRKTSFFCSDEPDMLEHISLQKFCSCSFAAPALY